MEAEQALRVSSRLAQKLLPFWYDVPQIQPILHALLGQWRTLQRTDYQFFDDVKSLFIANGVSDQLLQEAVDAARTESVDDDLRAMFEQAVACARTLYASHGVWTGGDVSFEVFPCREPQYPEHDIYGAFGASARTTPGVAGQDAAVELLLVPELLGPPTWASIPYVLCHELLCHASQALPSSDITDPFTEGWMDEIARQVHAKNVGTLFPLDPDMAAQEGGRLCDALRRLGTFAKGVHHEARSARLTGVRAACLAQQVLGNLAELSASDDGWGLFERLSVQLNTVPATNPRQDLAAHIKFVSNVNAGRRVPRLAVQRDALLRKWLLAQVTAAEVLSFM
jgi:hypothetical protein